MNGIVEFYQSNHLSVLITVVILFGIYISSIKNRNQNIVTMNSENEDKEEIVDLKIETWSIVTLKYILTGEVVTCDFAKNKSNKYKKPFRNIKRIYFDNPLAVALFDKETGDIIKYKENELDENYIYVEVLNVNNNLFTDEEFAMYGEKGLTTKEVSELEVNGIPINIGTKCNSKDELILVFKSWLETNETAIGDIDNYPKYTKWIFLNLNGNNYFINADTTREGIVDFVNNHENNNSWKVIANRDKIFNKVSNDVASKAIKGLYFYSESIGQREI
jgi:hypothetical protein